MIRLTQKREPLAPAHLAHPGRGHRPCHSARLAVVQPGAKAPDRRPPRHRRALHARRVGHWPIVVPGPAGLRDTVRHGRGKRGSRFLVPPGGAKAPSPLDWQRPSPLPQRKAGPCPAGGQSPRPAPAPPPAGASLPPGRALASVSPGPAGLRGTDARGRGKRGSRFLIPPALTKVLPPASMAGAIAPATALHWHQDQPGAKAPGQRPTRPWPALACGWCGLHRSRRKRRARARERLCVSGACPQGHPLSRGREDFPGRQAVGLLFQHPVWPPCTPRLCAVRRLLRRAVRYPAYCPAPTPRNARCSRSIRCA